MLTGYIHPEYARSLSEFGEPKELSRCGGWILERPIPGTPYKDAMGCYPLFTCRDWRKLHIDITGLAKELLTLVFVTDPFADVDTAYLESCSDLIKPFKHHYIVDLSHPLENSVNKHHRYYARKSLREIEVEVCHEPSRYVGEWIRLYDNLVKKHNIRGIKAFSPECFHKQLNTPGMVLFVGKLREEVVGAYLVAMHNDVAYSHLSAFSFVGYQNRAAYGIRWTALEYLTGQKIRYVDMGGAAGLEENPTDGLSQFKQGWSNLTRTTYLCGRIFDRAKYLAICEQNGVQDTNYFPAYRRGEFG